MRRNLTIILLAIVALHLFHSCAQVGQLEGGKKDSIPPTWIGSRPLNYTTNFDGKKVKLYFDEYFKLDNAQNKFVMSPPTEEEPELKIWSKKLTVKLPDSLKENTTYTLQFADAIVDFTEGNPMEDLTFVFSTGETIDTMAIGGQLFEASTLKGVEGVYVGVFQTMQDSTPYLQKPDYVAKTDSAGRFLISHMHPANYHLFALHDQNRNLLFDMPTEKVAFLDSIVIPKAESIVMSDTLVSQSGERDSVVTNAQTLLSPNNIQMFLFEEEHRRPYIEEYKRPRKHQLQWKFNRLLDEDLKVKLIKPVENTSEEWFIKEPNPTNDTIMLWITDTSLVSQDTLLLSAEFKTLDSLEQVIPRTDTLKIAWKVPETGVDSTNFIDFDVNVGSGQLGFGKSIYFYAGQIIEGFNEKRIHLYELKDSTVTDLRKQNLLRYQRPRPDSLIFWFERALPEEPYFSTASEDYKWFDYSMDSERRKVELHVLDTAVSNRDTIAVEAHFSNLFYNDAIVQDRKFVKIPYSLQSIIKAERVDSAHCVFYFNKISGNPFSIEAGNFSGQSGWITRQTRSLTNDSLRIDFWVNQQTAALNNIFVNVKIQDKLPNGNDTTLMLPIGFESKKQALLKSIRKDSTQLVFDFELPLVKVPELQPMNFRSKQKWFEASFNADSSQFSATLIEKNNIEQDSLQMLLSYTYLDSLMVERIAEEEVMLITLPDSLQNLNPEELEKSVVDSTDVSLPPKEEVEKPEEIAREYEIKTLNKIPFTIEKDKEQMRKFWLRADLAPEKEYRIRLDSMAFNTYWQTYNDSVSIDFQMKTDDEYGILELELSNYPENAILEVMDSQGEALVRHIGTITESNLTIELLEPGDYQLRVFADRNKNSKWDSGNFLEKRQPERMYRYRTVIKIKEGWTAEETWDLSQYSESFGPVEEDEKEGKKGKKKGRK